METRAVEHILCTVRQFFNESEYVSFHVLRAFAIHRSIGNACRYICSIVTVPKRPENVRQTLSGEQVDMGEKRRRAFSAEFKASVALDALSKSASVAEIAQRHGLHPNVVLAWRERLKTFAPQAFAPAGSQNASAERLQREVDFLARALDRVRDSSAGR